MKVLVFPYQLVVCGTVVNAIDLGAALRDLHGHDVVLFATPGPMAALAEEKGLRLIPAPPARIHPSPARMRALRDVVRRERPDVIHAWDWYQCLDAYYVEHLRNGVPIVATDMEMTLIRLLPAGTLRPPTARPSSWTGRAPPGIGTWSSWSRPSTST